MSVHTSTPCSEFAVALRLRWEPRTRWRSSCRTRDTPPTSVHSIVAWYHRDTGEQVHRGAVGNQGDTQGRVGNQGWGIHRENILMGFIYTVHMHVHVHE